MTELTPQEEDQMLEEGMDQYYNDKYCDCGNRKIKEDEVCEKCR